MPVPGTENEARLPVRELIVVRASFPPTVTPTDFVLTFTRRPGTTEKDRLIRNPMDVLRQLDTVLNVMVRLGVRA